MAIKDCDKISNIIATSIIAGDDDLAQEIAGLTLQKKTALARIKNIEDIENGLDELTGLSAKSLQTSASAADIKLNSIIGAKVLRGGLGQEAYNELAKQITKSGGSMAGGITLLEKVRNASISDYADVARMRGDDTIDPSQIFKTIDDKISDYTAAQYALKNQTELGETISKIDARLAKKEITEKQAKKEIEEAKVLAYKNIKEGKNPSGYAKLDEEWSAIKKISGGDADGAGKMWNQYVMAKSLIAYNDDMVSVFNAAGLENLTGKLTINQIQEYGEKDLDKILARAFTNTKDLYEDAALRQAYKEKLIEVVAGGNISELDESRIASLVRTLSFSEEGATFSQILKYDTLWNNAKKRGLPVQGVNSRDFYHGLEDYVKKLSDDISQIPDVIEIAGVKMLPIDLVQLIYDATGDKNIIKLLNIGEFSDTVVLDIATQYFVGNNVDATKKIMALFSKAREDANITNTQDLVLKTMTGSNIKEGAPKGFFNYREALYQKNELNRYRADFMDALANRNSMQVPGEIEDFTKFTEVGSLKTALEKLDGGYLFVNDLAYKDNAVLRQALNELEKDGKDITVLFPNKMLSANFTMDNGKLVFRTTQDKIYNDVAGAISISTLGEATPTREMANLSKGAATGTDLDGKTVNQIKSLTEYNDELNNAAIKYFGEMLGVSGKKVDKQYIDRVHNLLSEKTGIDIKALSEIKDRSMLWQMVDTKFSLAKLTAGKYDTIITDIGAELRRIDGLSAQSLAEDMALSMGDVIVPGRIIDNPKLNQIKEAYKDFRIAENAVDSLSAKGRIISLMNGGSAETMTIDEIQQMFQNRTFDKIYKNMFFPEQVVSAADMNVFINQINDNIFDSLSIGFAENLVSAGYDLPLVNVKGFVYDYLNGSVDINNKFIQAFLLKNNTPKSVDNVKGLLSSFMPKEFRFGYEDALYKIRGIENGQKSVFREGKNRFLQDSYSALATIESVKHGGLPEGQEKKILNNILQKYKEEMEKGMANGMKFQEAQSLKQEASYALDMFEQDFLEPRYGQLLTSQERQQLMGMKYSLPIGVSGQNANQFTTEMEATISRLLKRYDNTLEGLEKNNQINRLIAEGSGSDSKKMAKKIEERKKLLKENGAVIKEIDGQYVVYDSRKALRQALDELPSNIQGFDAIKNLSNAQLRELSNEQVYGLLRYVEGAKAFATRADYVTELMYKQNPLLLKYAFFDTFYVVDRLPRALKKNALASNKVLSKIDNTADLDATIKRDIFKNIKSEFNKNGYLSMNSLKKIISDAVADNEKSILVIGYSPSKNREIFDAMNATYQNAFTPYTYLRDIPKGGTLMDEKTTLFNVKGRLEQIMKEEIQQIQADLKNLDMPELDGLMDGITVRLTNGDVATLRQLQDYNIDSWKKAIFDDETVFVESADRVGLNTSGTNRKKILAQEKQYREQITNSYNATLQSMMNGTQIISEAEAKLMTAFMRDVKTLLRKGSLTNMIVDATDALTGLNEEAARGLKDYLIGWRGQLSFGSYGRKDIEDRLRGVQDAYRNYYSMTLENIDKIRPSTQGEDLAKRLAKYFKSLERYLGSADGATGCTTRAEINRAFYHIGETFLNVRDTRGVFGMLSAIEQNQILKFFKFSESGQASYVPQFVRNRGARQSNALGGYRDYVTDIIGIDASEFNQIFGSALSEDDFKKVLQGLSGFTLTNDGWGRYAERILNFLNGSHFVFRFLMSYPGQLLTIPQQGVAYFLKQTGLERQVNMESLSEIDEVRSGTGILDGAYNELPNLRYSSVSPDDVSFNSFYNRYGIPDVDRIYKNTAIETTNDYLGMYSKIDDYASKNTDSISWWFRQVDPYKDNANNIIDGLFARNFKNLSFAKALKENDFLQFTSARAFKEFMDNPAVSANVKQKLMDRVAAYSGRNFTNILGLGFGGLNRPVAGSGFGNIMYGLMQLFNFRGARGQNIFKQTGANIVTMIKMAHSGSLGSEGREAIARYVATQPEFLNFIQAAFNDIKRTWKLQRFQDNGRRPGEDYYGLLDFVDYFTDTLNMTSQWYQGIQSFGPARPFLEQGESISASMTNPAVYKDTRGVGAFFNALGKNAGRQRKPINWITKLIGAFTTDGWSGAEAFIENKFWELSFGSLRYMVNEDSNSYGYTYELIGQQGGIPSILMGEAPLGSDKSFSYELDNTETRKTIQAIASGDTSRDDKRTYVGNLWKAVVNGSQLFSIPKNVRKAVERRAPSYYTSSDLAETLQSTAAGKEFYNRGYVTPSTKEEAKMFVDYILKNGQYRPGSTSFNKSIVQFDSYGHMDGKTGKAADAEMELWLEHMKYMTNEHGEFVKGKDGKQIDPNRTRLMADIQNHFYNSDYVAERTYVYAKQWLDNHPSDPNYNLYLKMLGQGEAVRLIKQKEEQMLDYYNAGMGKKANEKWNKTEFENSGKYSEMLLELGTRVAPGDTMTFFDRLNVLDTDSATAAGLIIIREQMKNQSDRETLDKFFNITTDDDGIKSIEIKSQYKSVLTQIGDMARALDAGNHERFRAVSSSLVHQFQNDDPTGVVTATLIDSIFNRIESSTTLSALQKQEAIIELFHDNKEFIQKNPDKMREMLGDDYDLYAKYMNELLYQRDGQVISNMESVLSSGDKSASSATSKASKLSSSMKDLGLSYGGINYGSTKHGSTNQYKEFVPTKIQGANLVKELGVKGYTPDNIKQAFHKYSSNIDLSLGKDINRKVKNTKTQTISNKKQLSNIETKTQKAQTAES